MTFGDAIKTCFSKYVTFSGRAPRSEFWWFVLFVFVGFFATVWLDIALFGTTEVEPGSVSGESDVAVFSLVFGLGTLLPYISVIVRRLHDTDRNGWWYWIGFVPLIGFILLVVWWATKGTEGPNRFGADPLDPDAGGGGQGGRDEGLTASRIPTVPRA